MLFTNRAIFSHKTQVAHKVVCFLSLMSIIIMSLLLSHHIWHCHGWFTYMFSQLSHSDNRRAFCMCMRASAERQ